MNGLVLRAEHSLGFTLDAPDSWEAVHDPSPGVALALLAPEAAAFRPNVVATVGPTTAESGDLGAWQRAAADGLGESVDDFQLLDAEVDEGGFRQLAAYVDAHRSLTLEQWAWRWQRPGHDTLDVTLSATVPTLLYDVMADELATVAASWRPLGEAK